MLTPNGKWAYVANAGSSSVSSYSISPAGKITLANPVAGSTGEGSSASDMAMARDGKNLYVRAGSAMMVAAYAVSADGSLTRTPGFSGLPATAVALAAN